MPYDRITNSSRSQLSINHAQDFGDGLTGLLNFNRVSDDAYFRDLSDTITGTSQTELIRQGMLSYTGGWWQAYAGCIFPLNSVDVDAGARYESGLYVEAGKIIFFTLSNSGRTGAPFDIWIKYIS
jgi:lipopolysaccharide assembly outer membrane protein LptD (OstA)